MKNRHADQTSLEMQNTLFHCRFKLCQLSFSSVVSSSAPNPLVSLPNRMIGREQLRPWFESATFPPITHISEWNLRTWHNNFKQSASWLADHLSWISKERCGSFHPTESELSFPSVSWSTNRWLEREDPLTPLCDYYWQIEGTQSTTTRHKFSSLWE